MGYGVALLKKFYTYLNAEDREHPRNAARGRPYRACTAHTLAAGIMPLTGDPNRNMLRNSLTI
jgi:hypothetical protein